MVKNDKVAVITRTKDRPHFLARAIQSVAQQDYKNYVHVIINDGGDASVLDGVVGRFEKEVREKIKVFHRETSSNAPDTIFNESIDRVSSEYFALHDDDDTWHVSFLSATVLALDNNAKLGACVVRTDKVIEKVNRDKIETVKVEQYLPDVRAISLYRQCIDNQLTPISTLYRRTAYESVGKFDSALPVVGDWEFGIRLLQKFDVEYLDPGYALANYHHRKVKDNSFSGHSHRKYITEVMNKYLRLELEEGRLGVGYIMNSLRYEQDLLTTTIKRLLPKSIAGIIRKKVR